MSYLNPHRFLFSALVGLSLQACRTTPDATQPTTNITAEVGTTPEGEPGTWTPDFRNTEETSGDGADSPETLDSAGNPGLAVSSRTISGLGDIEVLDINHALWGVDIPNSVKGLSAEWDPVSGNIYSGAIMGPWMLVSRPDAAHPHTAIDLEIDGTHTHRTAIDVENRRLFWVDTNTERIRVIDLESGTVIARHDPSTERGGYPVQGIAIDSSTGWLWVVNTNQRRVLGYSPDLSETHTVTGVTAPVAISASHEGDGLYILDTVSRQEGRLVHYQPSTDRSTELETFAGRGRPPRYVAALAGGGAVVASRELVAFDRQGSELWRQRLAHPAQAVEASGDVVTVIIGTSGAPARVREHADFVEDPLGRLVVYGATNGNLVTEAELRYEAGRMSIDPEGRRAFVGNGGDGSISVVDLDGNRETHLIDVANAAEGAVTDTASGRRFVLNRLGGSEIYAWDADGLSRFANLPWPFELAIDSARRQLMAVSYFEATVWRWNIDTGETLSTIDLGIPEGTGDTLGDVSYDPETGLIAVVLPQAGWVALADIDTGQSLWTHQLAHMQVGDQAGPGRGFVTIGQDRVHVVGGEPLTATSLSTGSGTVSNERALSSSRSAASGQSAYRLNTLYFDSSGQRLFHGANIIDPDTLEITRVLDGVHKIFFADEERVLAMDVRGEQEYIVELEPESLIEENRWPVAQTETIRTESNFDPETRTVLVSDLPRAEVLAIPIP